MHIHNKEIISFEDLAKIYLSKLKRDGEEMLKIENLYFVNAVTEFGKHLDETLKKKGGVIFHNTHAFPILAANFLNQRKNECKLRGEKKCEELFECGVQGFSEWLEAQKNFGTSEEC